MRKIWINKWIWMNEDKWKWIWMNKWILIEKMNINEKNKNKSI